MKHLFFENYRSQYTLKYHYGRGAGYIGGFTAYIAINCQTINNTMGSERPIKLFQIGITRNANKIPLMRR